MHPFISCHQDLSLPLQLWSVFAPPAKKSLQTAVALWSQRRVTSTQSNLVSTWWRKLTGSQVVAWDAEQREAAGSEIRKCDSLGQFFHRIWLTRVLSCCMYLYIGIWHFSIGFYFQQNVHLNLPLQHHICNSCCLLYLLLCRHYWCSLHRLYGLISVTMQHFPFKLLLWWNITLLKDLEKLPKIP